MTPQTCLLFFMTGFLASFFCGTIFRLKYDLSNNDNALKRSIFRTFMINAAIMLASIFFYIAVYAWHYSGHEVSTPWVSRALSFYTADFICLLTISCSFAIVHSLVCAREVSFRHMVYFQLPILLFWLGYVATGSFVAIHGCQAYAVVCWISVICMVIRNYTRYETLVRETYSDIEGRSIRWLVAFLLPSFVIFLFWSYAVSVNTPELVVLYEIFILLINIYYVRRIELQNYRTEEVSVEETFGLALAEASSEHTEIRLDPLLSKQIEQYCIGQRAFANPDLTVGDVVKAVGSNRNYVSRWFNERGENFNTYINDLRIQEAERLLRTSDRSVDEIGIEVGFNITHTFARVFRNKYGCTPRQYREKMLQG